MLLQYQIDVLPMEGLFLYIQIPFFEITTINTAAFLAQSLLTSTSKLKKSIPIFCSYWISLCINKPLGLNIER